MLKIRSVGLLAEAGEVVTHERTDRKNHRPLLWIPHTLQIRASLPISFPVLAGSRLVYSQVLVVVD